MTGDAWDALGARFVDVHYSSLRGRVRTEVIHAHLMAHLPASPCAVVDVGGGAGHQSIPLARLGHDVTILDPSPAMLERAERRVASEQPDTGERIRLVAGRGEDAVALLDGARFDAVLCHGVLMYLDDPAPLVRSLCALAGPGGLVSIVAKNVELMPVRHALHRRPTTTTSCSRSSWKPAGATRTGS